MNALALALVLAGEPELLVGGHAHGAEHIAALAELGLGNFAWIPKVGYAMGSTPWDAAHTVDDDVDACLAAGLSFMISQRRGLGQAVRPGGFEHGGDCSGDLLAPDQVTAIARRAGGRFVGLHAEELDADFVQSAIRPSFRSRVPELYDFTDRAGGRRRLEAELVRQRDAAHAAGARYLPNLCVTQHLSGFRAGADLVLGELLEHLPTTELQLAYLRGGGRQFGRPWGVWISPWFWGRVPSEDPVSWRMPQAGPGGGHPPDALKRALYLSWVSGARLLTVQETEPLLKRVDGRWAPGPWGRVLREFWAVAREHPEPMRPIVPLAVLVDTDQGWAPAHLWQDWNQTESVWGKLPPDRADAMLPALFDALLPGFGRTTQSVAERRDGYPGCFCATPLGPFDVVAADIAADALAGYPAVVLAGDVDWSPELAATLSDYVRGGGRLLLNALHCRRGEVAVDAEPLHGVRLAPRIHAADRVVGTDPAFTPPGDGAEPWFALLAAEPTDAEVLARDPAGHPILTRRRLGAGECWLATPEYLLAGYGDPRAPLRLIPRLLAAVAGAPTPRCEPATDLSWIAARQSTDLVIAVANHADLPRRTALILADERLDLAVPARDVLLLRRPAR